MDLIVLSIILALVYFLRPDIWVTHGTTRYWLNASVHHYQGCNWDIYLAVCKHNWSLFIRR